MCMNPTSWARYTRCSEIWKYRQRMCSTSALRTSTQPCSRRRKQAAGLVIGNEILNGKTLDTNTQVLAQFLFARGITLARCETIPDDVPTIRKAVSRLASGHDYVFTSGGIGPTLDDVTYQVCLSKAPTPFPFLSCCFFHFERYMLEPDNSHECLLLIALRCTSMSTWLYRL
jgi:molybdenum cofactor synthesis domain-containing protein